MDYPEERKQYIDGIACQYLCHIEKQRNRAMYFSLIFIIILKCSMHFPVISVFI